MFTMKDKPAGNKKSFVFILILAIILFLGCNSNQPINTELSKSKTENKKTQVAEEYSVPAPPFSEGSFPCTDCHANFKPNPVKRVLVDWHQDISEMFTHDSLNLWCLDCHDFKDRNHLRLASGKLLDFKESYKLCGQCHGEKFRDWKVGVHGKRTGEWDGKKEYLLCVNCHNPHSPKFKQLKPEPPPVTQEDLVWQRNQPVKQDSIKKL
jgi:hypothetical protein